KTLSEGDSRKSLKPGDYKKMDLLIQIYLLQSSFLKDYATVSQHELTLWLGVCCQQPALLKAMPSFHTHPTELLLETGLCYRAPGGLAAGAGGRQEQAPSAMDSSSALAESARERPELGMTPPSKVPDGFIRRPKLR
ncbi:Isoleucine--tRNA ligase, partial [Dissostichus eleginoides]